MNVEAKIENPICIRLGDNENLILADDVNKENNPLSPGAMFGGEHYGFVLIIDSNGKQKEIVYPTQCRIVAAGTSNGTLLIFEEDKKTSWRFDKSGKLEHSIFDEFTEEYRRKADMLIAHSNMFMGEPTLKNPISIKVSKDPNESVILEADQSGNDYPVYPGVMLGSVHYGFVLIIDTEKGQKEVYYPTQNKIDCIGTENPYADLKVYENGKYHPWRFTPSGKLKEEASYNPFSRRDIAFVEDVYSLNMQDAEDCFSIKVKR